MKKMMLTLALALVSAAGYSQDVLGKWYTEAGDAQVEIYKAGDKLNGKIIWLSKGPETKDTHNPDKKLQSRKLMGVNILSGLAKGKDKWEGGKIYNQAVRFITPRTVRATNAPCGWRVRA